MTTDHQNLPEVYRTSMPMKSAESQIKGMMQRYGIQADELTDYKLKLEKLEAKDLAVHENLAICLRKEQTQGMTLFQKILHFFVGIDTPETGLVQHSVQTKLYGALVQVGDELAEEYARISEVPNIVQKMTQEHDYLIDRQEEIIQTLRRYESMKNSAPERIEFLQKVSGDLLQYNLLSSDKKAELAKAFDTAEVVPSLDLPEVRDMYLEEIQAQSNQLEHVLVTEEFSITAMQEEEKMINQDLALLEEQYCRLKEGFFPTLHTLHNISLQYKRLQRFTPIAEQIIGQNNFRKNAPHLENLIKDAISDALDAIEETEKSAQNHEDAHEEVVAHENLTGRQRRIVGTQK